jgi:hypothetical protein
MLFPPFEIAIHIADRKDHATVLSLPANKLRFAAMAVRRMNEPRLDRD